MTSCNIALHCLPNTKAMMTVKTTRVAVYDVVRL